MSNRSYLTKLVSLGIALLLGAIPALAGPAGAEPQQALSSWTQIWADEFNGSGGVNTGDWLYDIGTCYPGCPAANWGTGEIESMTNSTSNVFQSGGSLNIRALHSGTNPLTGWTSGRIETQRTDFQPPAGGGMAIEARIQLPNVTGAAAQGYWPAFWTLGAPFRGVYTNWPSVGEIDIMENINGVNTWYGTLHCGVNPGGPCNETTGIGGNASGFSPSLQAGYHTYRMEFDKSLSPQQLRWYVDGTQRFTINANQVDATTWNNATNHGFFVILNVAIGGGWPGNPTSSTASGGTMLVDYVRVYTANGGGGATATPTRTNTPNGATATRTRTPTRTNTPGGPTPTRTRTPTPGPTATRTPTPGGGGRDAYSTIQAESYNAQSGTQLETTTDTGGGQNVAYIANGDWLRYDNVNFGGASPVTVQTRSASGISGGGSGLVEFHLDSTTGPMIASFAIANTGGWQSWTTIPMNTTSVTGTRTLYIVFKSGQPADFVNVNWFYFTH